jgi:hypothetical protein
MRRTMAIMVLLAVISLYPSMFPLVSCVVSCDVLSLIVPPRAAYRLSADWIDKDPRTGILGS